jgi:hypothetical protein
VQIAGSRATRSDSEGDFRRYVRIANPLYLMKIKLIPQKGTCQSINCNSDLPPISTEKSDYVVPIRDSWVDRRNPPHTSHSSFSWRLEMPTWITSKALELTGLKAPHGWKIAFRAYNIISIDSTAVDFVMTNNFAGIQELFASRRASPFDKIDINGFNLLHVSSPYTQYNTTESSQNLSTSAVREVLKCSSSCWTKELTH